MQGINGRYSSVAKVERADDEDDDARQGICRQMRASQQVFALCSCLILATSTIVQQAIVERNMVFSGILGDVESWVRQVVSSRGVVPAEYAAELRR